MDDVGFEPHNRISCGPPKIEERSRTTAGLRERDDLSRINVRQINLAAAGHEEIDIVLPEGLRLVLGNFLEKGRHPAGYDLRHVQDADVLRRGYFIREFVRNAEHERLVAFEWTGLIEQHSNFPSQRSRLP